MFKMLRLNALRSVFLVTPFLSVWSRAVTTATKLRIRQITAPKTDTIETASVSADDLPARDYPGLMRRAQGSVDMEALLSQQCLTRYIYW